MEIKGKVVIVTGASQGIGLATAKLLSKEGAKVALAARSPEIKNLEKELPESFAVLTDLRQPDDVKNLVKMAVKKFGRIDILINNAGQGMHGYAVKDTPISEYREIMELNVFSVVRLMQEVVPVMKKEGGGMIINVSSKVTKMHIPNLAAYSSTKYALNSITQTAREELKDDNIVVSAVLPSLTATSFFKNSIGAAENNWMSGQTLPEADSPEKVAKTIFKTIETEEAEVLV